MSDNKSTISAVERLGVEHKNMDDQGSRVGALTEALNATTISSKGVDVSPIASPVASPSPSPAPTQAASVTSNKTKTGTTTMRDRFNKAKNGNQVTNNTPVPVYGGPDPKTVTTNVPQPKSQVKTHETTQFAGGNRPSHESGVKLNGSNIGSAANEPEWTNDDINAIQAVCRIELKTVSMTETRRSSPDPQRKYLEIDSEGTVMTKPAGMLPRIGWNEFALGLGKPKADEKTGKGKLYSDVVMKGPDWVLNQWTSLDVVIEGVADNILEKPARMVNGRPERRIGHDFARIGLPKTSFGPILETLSKSMPTILESVTVTAGYYWLNASWGVTGSPGKFAYSTGGGSRQPTSLQRLYEAMKILQGMSSYGVATIAISIAAESRMEGGKLVTSTGKYELSVKIHNMFHTKKVNYRSPPQSSANGFQLPDDIMMGAETLEPSTNMGGFLGSSSSMFSGGSINPFANASLSISNDAAMGAGRSGNLL